MTDEFLTIAGMSEGYFMDKGSKFLAIAYPVSSEEEAQNHITALRKAHPKARHFCTGLRLGLESILERSSDDGEPSGSAGKPILGQLIKNQLTEILVVVVRYFGGTKLGIPGLIEAYRESTVDALSKATIIKKRVHISIQAVMPYDRFSSFKNMIIDQGNSVINESFDEMAMLEFGIRKSDADEALIKMLKTYSQRDFIELKEYETYLQIKFKKSEDHLLMQVTDGI